LFLAHDSVCRLGWLCAGDKPPPPRVSLPRDAVRHPLKRVRSPIRGSSRPGGVPAGPSTLRPDRRITQAGYSRDLKTSPESGQNAKIPWPIPEWDFSWKLGIDSRRRSGIMVQMLRDSRSHCQVEHPVQLFRATRRLTGPDRSRVRVATTAESTRICFKTFLGSPFHWVYVGFRNKL